MTGQRFFMASELRSSSWLCIEEEEKKLQNPLLCGIFSPAKTIPFHRPNNFTWNRICIRQVLPMHSQNSHQKVIKNPSFSWKLGNHIVFKITLKSLIFTFRIRQQSELNFPSRINPCQKLNSLKMRYLNVIFKHCENHSLILPSKFEFSMVSYLWMVWW